MLHITYICEDQIILATIHNGISATLKVVDSLSGEEREVDCNPKELAAAMALSIGSDEIEGSDALYALAEPLMKKLEVGEDKMRHALRFIP